MCLRVQAHNYIGEISITLESFCLDDFFISGKYLQLKYKHNLCKYYLSYMGLLSPHIALDHLSHYFTPHF